MSNESNGSEGKKSGAKKFLVTLVIIYVVVSVGLFAAFRIGQIPSAEFKVLDRTIESGAVTLEIRGEKLSGKALHKAVVRLGWREWRALGRKLKERDQHNLARYFHTRVLRRLYEKLMTFWNFFVILFTMVHFARKPLLEFLDKRARDIKQELDDIAERRRESEEDLRAAMDRLGGLDGESEQIRRRAAETAEKTRKALREETESTMERLEEAREKERQQIYKRARKQMQTYLVNRAVKQAEAILREETEPEAQERLIRRFIEELKTVDLDAHREAKAKGTR